jgi:chlorobactene glucosyltransferase
LCKGARFQGIFISMSVAIFFLVLSSILFVAGMVVTFWIHGQYGLEKVPEQTNLTGFGESLPLISVIIPARNEARNIRRCVESLLVQTYPNYEIIVVNDRSTDATGQILEEIEQAGRGATNSQAASLRVLQGEELPDGWAGKPHVLVQGAEAANGEWLCFIDADTFAGPQLLSAAFETAMAKNVDLFTILTAQELGTFWEKVILPLVFTALSVGFPAERVNDPDEPDAIANGQFILVRRDAYTAVGGHQAVYNQIAEDKALADVFKRKGYRLFVADGRDLASTRMYTSLAEIWEGWTKNIFLGMRDRLGLLLFGAVVGLIAALLLPVWLAGGIAWAVQVGGWLSKVVAIESVILWVTLLWVRGRASKAFAISPLYAFTLPLGAFVFSAMMIVSTYRVVSGQGVTWKGRTYA